jgi:hypothetical protein
MTSYPEGLVPAVPLRDKRLTKGTLKEMASRWKKSAVESTSSWVPQLSVDDAVKKMADRWKRRTSIQKQERRDETVDKEATPAAVMTEGQLTPGGGGSGSEGSFVSSASSSTMEEFVFIIQQKLSFLSAVATEARETIKTRLQLAHKVTHMFIFLLSCWLPLILVGIDPESVGPAVVSGCMFLVCVNSLGNVALFVYSEQRIRRALREDFYYVLGLVRKRVCKKSKRGGHKRQIWDSDGYNRLVRSA